MIIRLFIISCFFLVSCSKSFNNKRAIIEYVENPKNKYILEKNVNNINFKLILEPTDYLIAKTQDQIDRSLLDSLRSNYKSQLYFSLSMSYDGKEILSTLPKSQKEYSYLSQQLNFGLSEKVSLVNNLSDTLQLMDYNFSKLYGMGPNNTVLFIFESNENTDRASSYTFRIEEFGLLTGDIVFHLDQNKLKNQPTLNL